MPIPVNQIRTAEIGILGTAATGGSSITPSINIFHYQRAGVSVAPSKAALNTAFQAAIVAPLLAAMNVRYTPGTLYIRWIDDCNDAPAVFNVAGVGAIATDSLPSDAAIYCLLRTALRGRNYRGSKHFSPGSEVDTTNDLLTGAGLVRWQAVQTALRAPITDATPNTWNLAVVSRALSQLQTNPTTVVVNNVIDVLLDLNVGTMRKRRSKTVR